MMSETGIVAAQHVPPARTLGVFPFRLLPFFYNLVVFHVKV